VIKAERINKKRKRNIMKDKGEERGKYCRKRKETK
jgi:hypothetical protein